MRVNLYFTIVKDPELEQKVPGVDLIRLKTRIRFKIDQGWTEEYSAIVDTGAPVSLIPAFIWEKIQRVEYADHQVGGLGKGSIPVSVGRIGCMLTDRQGNKTKELEVIAYLAKTDKVPLILGFKDLLEGFNICFDHREKRAYVEDKSQSQASEG